MQHIGLVLPQLPGYSETFLINKIKGLIEKGYRISLFVRGGPRQMRSVLPSTQIYYQLNIRNKIKFPFVVLYLFMFHFNSTRHFIKLERSINRNWYIILKNIIINSYILNKKLDWLHFCYCTMALNKENIALAIGARCSVSLRGYDINLYPIKHPGCYDLLWLKIDKVHTISNSLYMKSVNMGLNKKLPMEKITPAIDIDLFKPSISNIFHTPIRILTVARLSWIKGIEYGLKAMDRLKKRGIEFEYRIIGDGEYREAIIYTINQLNLNDDVVLLNKLSQIKVANEMQSADIYLQPSIEEGFCNATLEAQATGLLCITTDAGGLPENVLHEKTGWVVPKRSSKLIADQIAKVIKLDPEKREKIRNQAISRIKMEYNVSNQSKRFDNFYAL